MSLNKTLDRLFDEIRREAKRNPAFADRLDAVLRTHASRREVAEAALAEAAGPAPAASARAKAEAGQKGDAQRRETGGAAPFNPVALLKRAGESALASALAGQDLTALRALVTEHNLDPGGVTAALSCDALAAHILAQAKRRAERDEKMFDY